MEESKKQQIRDRLVAYCERHGSQNRASKTLKGVSAATISQVINGNWDLIRDEMWRSIDAQVATARSGWTLVGTRAFKALGEILYDAQDNSFVFAVTGEAGTGKTAAIRAYQADNRNVFVLSCSDYWNRRLFMSELLRALGCEPSGSTVGEMMYDAVQLLERADKPLIVLDEADKLPDKVFYFFISLYNALEDRCGFVLVSTDYLERRIRRGLRLQKEGYKEIYSRVCRKFIPLPQPSQADIIAVCTANGVEDRQRLKDVVEDCQGDLRRVKRKVHAIVKSMSLNTDAE